MSAPTAPNGPIRPAGRSLAEFGSRRPAEEKLLAACRLGRSAEIGAVRPEQSNQDNSIRAEFLRFLALGGDERAPVHEHGVQVAGAWIEGELDLEAATVTSPLTLFICHFDAPPIFRDARIAGTLNLEGCKLPGLAGNRMVCEGSVFLRNGFVATGIVNLHSARITNNLACSHANFSIDLSNAREDDPSTWIAFCAQSAVIGGGAFLNDRLNVVGEVQLLNIQVGGDMDFRAAILTAAEFGDHPALTADRAMINGDVFLNRHFVANGRVSLTGAQIEGSLDCSSATLRNEAGPSLVLARVVIKGALIYLTSSPVTGVSLESCHIGQLIDDEKSWGENIVMDGFSYGGLTGGAPTDPETRLAWLGKQQTDHFKGANFTPQPWQQLIRCLRAMGHIEEARQIAIRREVHLRDIDRIGQAPSNWNDAFRRIYRLSARGLHRGFGLLADYGYHPLKLVGWMTCVWLLAGSSYWWAAQNAVFAPSNPLVFDRIDYDHCRPNSDRDNGKARVGNWYLCPTVPGEYTAFSPLAYSLDLILPLVDLQQERDWAPIVPTPEAAWYVELLAFDRFRSTRLLIWLEFLFGWIASLLLVAVLSGLTNRDRE